MSGDVSACLEAEKKIKVLEEKLRLAEEALGMFQLWFKLLPENKTLFTEGKNPTQDALVEAFHAQTKALLKLRGDRG